MTRKHQNSQPARDYAIGYCRPPVATRFKPNQSGNPNGRPKGSKSLQNVIADELNVRVSVTENGKTKKITKKSIVAKQLVNKGAKGDTKGIDILLKNERLAEESFRTIKTPVSDTLCRDDELVMANILRRIQEARTSPEPISADAQVEMPDDSDMGAPP